MQTVFATAVKNYCAALVAQKNIQVASDIEADAKHVLEAAVVRVQKGVAAVTRPHVVMAASASSQAASRGFLNVLTLFRAMKNRADFDLSIAVPPRLPAPLNGVLLTQLVKTPGHQAVRGSRGYWLHRFDAK